MLRLTGTTIALLALLTSRASPPPATRTQNGVRELLTAAQGAPVALCALASRAVGNYNGRWHDAPVTPLGSADEPSTDDRDGRGKLAADDIRLLLESLATADPCVRELAVRLLGNDESDAVASGLVQRLSSPDSSLRTVAAYGLGLAEPRSAVDPLVRAIRDPATGPRANAVWALGRIGDGRAVAPVSAVVTDRSPLVRQAAAGTLGQLDSSSAIPVLQRVLREDAVPSVRRTAAWALGELEAEPAVPALTTALRQDKDASVREMCAWALGNIETKSASADLLTAARGDADASVRETAVWALGNSEDASVAAGIGQLLATEKDTRGRRTAAWALGQLELDHAPKGLIDALSDADAGVRTRSAWALSEIGDQAALPALRTALARETDEKAKRAELRGLIQSGERSERLTELLQSPDPKVRETTIRGIAGRGTDPWPWPEPRPRPFP